MSSFPSRYLLFLGLALTGCASPAQDLSHLLWPDQFHLTYENGENEFQGPARDHDIKRDALFFGLSWDISSRNQGISREDLLLLIHELRQEAAPAPVTVAPTEASAEVAEAPAPIEEPPPPEPEPIVVAEEPPLEPVPEEPAPVEVVAEVVPEVAPPEPPPVEEPAPVVEEVVAESVSPVLEAEVAPEEPAPAPEPPAVPAPIAEEEGGALYGVVLVSALCVLGLALAIRFLPSLRTARIDRG